MEHKPQVCNYCPLSCYGCSSIEDLDHFPDHNAIVCYQCLGTAWNRSIRCQVTGKYVYLSNESTCTEHEINRFILGLL